MSQGMRIAVVGAGVIGVTTAFELASDGHDVTIFESGNAAAAQASFANAGVVSPGYVAPWAAPGMPGKVLAGFMREHAAVRLEGLGGPRQWAWLWRWWRACDAARYARRRASMLDLARASQTRLHELTEQLGLEWERRRGYLVLLRTSADVARVRATLAPLQDAGLNVQLLDAAACRALEPGLNPATTLEGGLHGPDNDIGNCRQFTLQLLEHAQALGVTLRLRHTVRRLRVDDRGVTLSIDARQSLEAVPTSRMVFPAGDRRAQETEVDAKERGETENRESEPRERDTNERSTSGSAEFDAPFDAAVVCAGVASAALLRRVRVRVPLLPVHGYSVTAPLRPSRDPLIETTPRAGLMDEAYKVAISRIGDRLRIAGSAEIGGDDSTLAERPLATLYKTLDDWFPNAIQRSMAVPWKGARPMLPDGPPMVGPTRHARLWVNVGHGSSGFALACGSARLLADQIAGRTPVVDAKGFTVGRRGSN